jgi:hypothetical protein
MNIYIVRAFMSGNSLVLSQAVILWGVIYSKMSVICNIIINDKYFITNHRFITTNDSFTDQSHPLLLVFI